MNRRIVFTALAAMAAASLSADVNAPDAAGYVDRGRAMYLDANYNGCIDQMQQARHLEPDAAQAEEAHRYIALATLGLGDDEALTLLESYITLYPQSIYRQQMLAAIGDYFFTRGDYGQAVTRYSAVALDALEPDTAEDVTYRLAYSRLMLADYAQAEALFASLQGAPRYAAAARFYEAYIAYARQDWPRALTLFKSVDTSTAPGNTADYYLAQLYFLRGDYREALAAARRMVAADVVPDFTLEARRIAGESLWALGDHAAALPYLWEYVAKASDPEPSAYYLLGVQEFDDADYKAAIKLLQKAVAADNAMGQNAYLYLGQCYLHTGQKDNALMAFENAYRMNYDPKVQETAFYNYAVARSEGGKAPFGSSAGIFEDFLRQYPSSRYAPAVQDYLVHGYINDGDYEGALASIDRIAHPSADMLLARQRVLLMMGMRDCREGKTALALERLQQCRAASPSDSSLATQALLWQGECHLADEQWGAAAEACRSFLSQAPADDPNRQLALYDLGYALFNGHQYPQALEAFTGAVNAEGSLQPALLADARNRMADCLAAAGDYTAAAAQYQKAYDLNPAAGDYALYSLASMKGLQGNNQGRIQTLDRLMERFPSSGLYPAALLAKAGTYASQGNTADAIATYRQLTRDYPQSQHGRDGQLQLAITYMGAGDRQRAIEAYRKTIYTYPTSEQARLAADDLRHIYAEDGKLAEYTSFMRSVQGAPDVDPSQIEEAAWEVAEEWYLDDRGTAKLADYLREYPSGSHTARALYYIAEDAEDKGDYDTAYTYATRVVLGYPDSDEAETALAIKGSCELHQGKGEIALATYRELGRKASSPAMLQEARMQVMRVARDLGRYPEVITVSEQLLATTAAGSAELPEIQYSHALALNATGRTDEALREWESLARCPDTLYGAKAAYQSAAALLEKGRTDKARTVVEAFLDSSSPQDYWRARSVILLSDILRKQGHAFEADQYLRSLRANYNLPATMAEIQAMIDERLK